MKKPYTPPRLRELFCGDELVARALASLTDEERRILAEHRVGKGIPPHGRSVTPIRSSR